MGDATKKNHTERRVRIPTDTIHHKRATDWIVNRRGLHPMRCLAVRIFLQLWSLRIIGKGRTLVRCMRTMATPADIDEKFDRIFSVPLQFNDKIANGNFVKFSEGESFFLLRRSVSYPALPSQLGKILIYDYFMVFFAFNFALNWLACVSGRFSIKHTHFAMFCLLIAKVYQNLIKLQRTQTK